MLFLVLSYLMLILPTAVFSAANHEIDVLVFDGAELPPDWTHVIGKNNETVYRIEEDEHGAFLSIESSNSGSWIEFDAGHIDPGKFPIMEWVWRVNRFPNTNWEMDRSQDDFAVRIELVYDYRGGWKNPLNYIRKGLITTIFRRFAPELTVSYVWSVNVPADVPYESPEFNTTVFPVESGKALGNRWIQEERNILEDFNRFRGNRSGLELIKVRIRGDTEDSGSFSESAIRSLVFRKVR